MTTGWVVKEATERIVVDDLGRAEVTITVTNSGPVQDRAVFDVVPEGAADAAWFSVEEPQRPVAPGASTSYLVKVAVPAGTAAGTFSFQGRAYSADRPPEESSALSGRVAFDVAETKPPPPKPWWLIPVGVAVVVVIAVVLFLVLRDGEGTVVAPELVGSAQDAAEDDLVAAGLATGDIKSQHDPNSAPGTVLNAAVDDETVDEGDELVEGTAVHLVVAVNLVAPVLTSPPPGALLTPGVVFVFQWQEVVGAPRYRVDVQRHVCRVPPVIAQPTEVVENGGFRAIPRANERFRQVENLFQCSFTAAVSEETADIEVSSAFVDPTASASGLFQWSVVALDDFGNPGPAAAFRGFEFEG
ncbi:MAG: hypothetical protein ACRD29_15140 [Acidimicrobiales bacterium]